jgi:signal transduction histidine kinase
LRLAEERSMELAEFLRGHVVYYRESGETLDVMFHRPDVLRRVVVEFGTLPELREVLVSLDGRSVSFRYSPDGEVTEDEMPVAQRNAAEREAGPRDSFRMIELPIETGADPGNRVELVGTMDYVNAYIGRYIILIYSLFTLMVGLATGVIGIIITDAERQRRRQYAELQETHQRLAQAAKLASIGELAGGMAHEINTPMTSILALATHLTEGRAVASLTPDQRKSLDVIATQAQRASRIVGNLLTFARQSRLELSRVDVGELLEMAIELVHYRLDHGTVRIDREIDEDLPFVLADAGRVTEVFINLLNNAIDAMPAGGTLVVRAYVKRDARARIRVEVTDTGCGISPDDLPRIFDPFFTTKPPGHGTGLGLSISHSIVKDHGGEIWAESCAGSGTTLVVTLPAGGDPK